MPFNLVMAALLIGLGGMAAGIEFRRLPCRVTREADTVRVRLVVTWPLTAGFVCFGLSCGLLAIALGMCHIGNWPPSIMAVSIAWGLAVVFSIAYAIGHRNDIDKGDYDLTIDPARGTVSVGKGVGGPMSASLSDVESVDLETIPAKDSESQTQFVPTLRLRTETGAIKVCRLVTLVDRESAELLIGELRRLLT